MVPVRGLYDVTAMCLRATGLRFFYICHCAELNKIVEAMMPVNPYDDRKVSLRRPHGNGDLDIVGASYTPHKANVTEALISFSLVSMLTENRCTKMPYFEISANARQDTRKLEDLTPLLGKKRQVPKYVFA